MSILPYTPIILSSVCVRVFEVMYTERFDWLKVREIINWDFKNIFSRRTKLGGEIFVLD